MIRNKRAEVSIPHQGAADAQTSTSVGRIFRESPIVFIIYGLIFCINLLLYSIEDLYEAIVNTVPGAKFGLAFCEASDLCIVR